MTIKPLLPTSIPIPASTAATLSLTAGEPTARDLSYAFAVMHLASIHGVQRGIGDPTIEIDDNALRQQLGRSSRDNIEREEERWNRLHSTRVACPQFELSATLPYLQFHETVRSKSPDGGYTFVINEELLDAFTVKANQPQVLFPRFLLRNAKSFHSVFLMLRVLAWSAGLIENKHEFDRTGADVVVRMPIQALCSALNIHATKSPANLMRDVLDPAIADINQFSDHFVQATLIRTKYRDGKQGKVSAVELRIAALGPEIEGAAFDDLVARRRRERDDDLEQRVAAEMERLDREEEREKRKPWRRPTIRPGRKKPAEPAPADVGNVVAMPIDTIRTAFVQEAGQSRIGTVRPPSYAARQDQGDDDVHDQH